VLLRFLLDDHPELSGKAAVILESMETGRGDLHCDPVTLAEVVWVLGSFYKQPNDAVARALEPIVKAEGFRMPDKARYIHALELFGRTLASFGDACARAAAIDDCEARLYSFDREQSGVNGVDRREQPE